MKFVNECPNCFLKSLYNSEIYIKLKIKIKIGWMYNIKRFTNFYKIFFISNQRLYKSDQKKSEFEFISYLEL